MEKDNPMLTAALVFLSMLAVDVADKGGIDDKTAGDKKGPVLPLPPPSPPPKEIPDPPQKKEPTRPFR